MSTFTEARRPIFVAIGPSFMLGAVKSRRCGALWLVSQTCSGGVTRERDTIRTLSRFSTLALTASRRNNRDNVCLHRGEPLIGILLLVNYFDLCRLEGSHVTAAAALLALVTLPPVLADAAAAALLALPALPPVLADAFAAALLADVAPPPVREDRAA